jgi:hypothetical protein
MLMLLGAYLLSGIGSDAYPASIGSNLLFALLQGCAILIPYWLFSCGVDWKNVRRDYFAWIGFCTGGVLTLQILWVYLTQSVIVDGIIHREYIYTGWGMYNNMGLMLAMMIPSAFCLASKYRRGWIGTVVGSVFLMGVLLTCSRTSLIIGVAIYGLCALLMLHYARNRRHNTVALVLFLVVSGLALLLFRAPLIRLFSGLLSKGADPSSRDVFFREGWKLFCQAPVFGSSFYSPGYVPWDFSTVNAQSALIPPRWHSTPLQLLVSCGLAGVCAYGFHRFQTLRLFLKGHTKEKTFLACAVGVLLLCSLLDCHFFNVGPVLIYAAALAFIEVTEAMEQSSSVQAAGALH